MSALERIQEERRTPIRQIRTLDEDVADWRSISHLDVSGNPFECDCRVAWLNELLRESPGLPRPHCHAPEQGRNSIELLKIFLKIFLRF